MTSDNLEDLVAPLANTVSISSLYSVKEPNDAANLPMIDKSDYSVNQPRSLSNNNSTSKLAQLSEIQQKKTSIEEKKNANKVNFNANSDSTTKTTTNKQSATGDGGGGGGGAGDDEKPPESTSANHPLHPHNHQQHHHLHPHLPNIDRETWSKKFDFLMSIIGFSVDLASIWRFPYLCFKNGGGAFLIPYTIMIFLLGLPLFFMELALGQYNKCGAITCWKKICPLLSGVGYAVVIIAFYTDFFYNVIISWGVFYLFGSFSKKLPWASCGNFWNTENCYEISSLLLENRTRSGESSSLGFNEQNFTILANRSTYSNMSISSSEEYFFNRMYKFTDDIGMNNFGSMLWENVVCLFVIYVVCYFSMWKGVQTSGKVVWVTALLPYVVLIILSIRALFLSGSIKGLEYYLTPRISILKNPMVWIDAASQVFFSLGPGFGVLLAFSSYNKFDNNIYSDAMITVFVNYMSSFVSGAVIFMYLGYMSDVTKKSIDEVAKEGSSLVFIVYPEAISTIPIPQFWSVIFFLMLITLGLDSSFGGSEAIITALADEYPILRKKREIFVAVLFSFYMFIGLPSCTQGGYYLVEFLNNYSAVYSILVAVLVENIAVAWLYGTKRFCDDIYEMIDYYPGRFWCYCWKYVTPICITFILIMGIYAYVPLEISRTGATYRYPTWSNVLGWVIAASSCICIPIVAIYYLCKAKGSLSERLKECIKPHRDQIPLDVQIRLEMQQTQPTENNI